MQGIAALAKFTVLRLLSALAVLVAVYAVTFLTFHLLRPEAYAFETRSLLTQLGDGLWRAVHGDLGESWERQVANREVGVLVGRGLPADLALVTGGLLLGAVAGIAAGAFCGARPGSAVARVLQGVALFFLCAPVYWVGLMTILFFAPGIGRVPVSFFPLPGTYEPLSHDAGAWLHSLVVPWLVLGAPVAAMALRMTRGGMGDALAEDFVRTATAKGLRPATVVRRHALPAAVSPTIALVGANSAAVITNAILVEHVFGIPGVFRLTTNAMAQGDFPLLQGIVLAGALLVVGANLAADIVHAWLDPRIRAA